MAVRRKANLSLRRQIRVVCSVCYGPRVVHADFAWPHVCALLILAVFPGLLGALKPYHAIAARESLARLFQLRQGYQRGDQRPALRW